MELGEGLFALWNLVGYISKSQFYNNSSSYRGGSVVTVNSLLSIRNATFENSVAGRRGGAICSINSSMNIEYCVFQNDTVSDKIDGSGGGIHLVTNSTMRLKYSSLQMPS